MVQNLRNGTTYHLQSSYGTSPALPATHPPAYSERRLEGERSAGSACRELYPQSYASWLDTELHHRDAFKFSTLDNYTYQTI